MSLTLRSLRTRSTASYNFLNTSESTQVHSKGFFVLSLLKKVGYVLCFRMMVDIILLSTDSLKDHRQHVSKIQIFFVLDLFDFTTVS